MMNDFFNNDWYEYSISAWKAAKAPQFLHPKEIYRNPINYDKESYKWLEDKYNSLFEEIFLNIEHIFKTNKNFPSHYMTFWREEYNQETIWKQLIPFIIFSDILSVKHSQVIKFSEFFIIGQAIPSVTINKLLDGKLQNESLSKIKNKSLFSIFSILQGLKGLNNILIPEMFNSFLDYLLLMYEKMWTEHLNRFSITNKISKDFICNYIYGESRLISTVFYSITIKSAYSYSNKTIPKDFSKSLLDLRKVRELNDELIDIKEDIISGLITLPVLIGLNNDDIKDNLVKLLKGLWKDKTNDSKLEEIINLLITNKSIEKSAIYSFELLEKVFYSIMNNFSKDEIFDLNLLINLRLALLTRLKSNKWRQVDIDLLYFPFS